MSVHLGDALSALADGELDADAADAARAHLAACAACAGELAAVEAVRTAVRSLPPVDPPRPLVAGPPDVVPLASRRPGRWAGLVAGAAAAAAMLLLPAVHQDVGGAPQVAELVQAHTAAPVDADVVSQVAPAALPISFRQ